ncbi:hypothetical protein C6Y14_43245 [Streptomyces dioscori]|uniref:HTH cro/C1-type domain-containing protein n=1 Tax=Streptomyces dioscori TaxID=2109333 RepID=A0A2P8PTE4_9ACTN|nr:hypothetical protein C6Y14_43245 [Streptomyces dioscori]
MVEPHAGGDGATFGTEPRRLRRAAGLSLADLAVVLGTGKGYLSCLERNMQRPSEQFARVRDVARTTGGALLALAGSLAESGR